MEHWLRTCPATKVRHHYQLFGVDSGDLGCLSTHPLKRLSLEYNGNTAGRWLRHIQQPQQLTNKPVYMAELVDEVEVKQVEILLLTAFDQHVADLTLLFALQQGNMTMMSISSCQW